MTNEEMQKTIDFIVEQDAKSGAKIYALAETQARTGQDIRALLGMAEIHEREILTMSDQISSVTREIATLTRGLATLGETTQATDGRLNTLINVVDRMIGNGRNREP